MRPENVVQRQVDAYNRRDLGAFSSTYADGVTLDRFPSMTRVLEGRVALERHYRENRFNRPELRAEILSRVCHGNKVIDHERVTGLVPGETITAVVIYEVVDGLIHRVWFVDQN
jgi:hypothetical protein